MTNIYIALEIGTTHTRLAVGEAQTGGRLRVSCHAGIPSTGVRKSQIVDLNQAAQSINSVIRAIERKQAEAGSSITVGNAFLAVSGQHVRVDRMIGTAVVTGARVGNEEIAAAANDAHGKALPKDRELLDIVDQDYELDNRGGISNPKGLSGRVLKLNTLQIHADADRVRDARSAADSARLEIREPLFAATCAAEAVLDDRERQDGALVIDLGGGSTGYAAYFDGFLSTAGVIGVGGDHVTNDIAHAFQTTQGQAEMMKVSEASAVLANLDSASARVKIPGSSPLMETRTVSRRALATVVNARMRELFGILRETLEEQDLLHRLHAGVVITGGGAALKDVDELARRELGMPVRLGRPVNVDGLDQEDFPPAFASIAGALLYAHRNYEEKPLLKSLFGGLFK